MKGSATHLRFSLMVAGGWWCSEAHTGTRFVGHESFVVLSNWPMGLLKEGTASEEKDIVMPERKQNHKEGHRVPATKGLTWNYHLYLLILFNWTTKSPFVFRNEVKGNWYCFWNISRSFKIFVLCYLNSKWHQNSEQWSCKNEEMFRKFLVFYAFMKSMLCNKIWDKQTPTLVQNKNSLFLPWLHNTFVDFFLIDLNYPIFPIKQNNLRSQRN